MIGLKTGLFGPILANWAIIHHNFTELGGCFTPNSFAYLYTDSLGVFGVYRPSAAPAALEVSWKGCALDK